MTNVTTWSLPLPDTVSLITTPDANHCVYFVTDLGAYFGALNLQTSQVSLWRVPADFWSPASQELEWIEQRGGKIWISLDSVLVNAIPPAPGAANQQCKFVAYFRNPAPPPVVPIPTNSVFPYPGSIALDGVGNIWYGSAFHAPPGGSNAASLGCLKGGATWWDLHSPTWEISQVWAEDDGKTLWFTTQALPSGGSGPMLGKLDAVHNTLTTVTLPASGLLTSDIFCLAGDAPIQPANIWFASSGGLFRWNTAAGQLFQYPITTALAPTGPLAINTRGVWVARGSTLSKVVLPPAQATRLTPAVTGPSPLQAVKKPGDGIERLVSPTTHTATKTTSDARPTTTSGFEDYPLPVNAGTGIGIIRADQYTRTNLVWFSQGAGQIIGVLEG
jgi:hypothetical protein